MKRVKYILLVFILIMPMIIKAGSYEVEVGNANSLLNKGNYFNTYKKYIMNGGNINFEYNGNSNVYNPLFTRGGFISRIEYKLTIVRTCPYPRRNCNCRRGVRPWTRVGCSRAARWRRTRCAAGNSICRQRS